MVINFDVLLILYPGSTNYSMVSNPANYSLPRMLLYLQGTSADIYILNRGAEESSTENLHFAKNNFANLLKILWRNRKRRIILMSCSFELDRLAIGLQKFFNFKIILRRGGIFWGRQYLESMEFDTRKRKYAYIHKADIFLSTADGTPVSLFLDKINYPIEKRRIWLNGFPEIQNYNKQQRKNIILCVSRLSGEKGIEFVIRTFAAALPLLDESYILNVIGDGPDKDKLLTLCHDLGVQNSVNFLGHKDGVMKYYKEAKLFINPLANNTLIECIATQLPVVSLELGEFHSLYSEFPNLYFIPYKKGGCGNIPLDELNELVLKTKEKVVEILNETNDNSFEYEVDIKKYGWPGRLTKEVDTYNSLFDN